MENLEFVGMEDPSLIPVPLELQTFCHLFFRQDSEQDRLQLSHSLEEEQKPSCYL